MKKQAWAKEPYSVVYNGNILLSIAGNGRCIAKPGVGQYAESEDADTFERMVSCTNAMAGIKDPAAWVSAMQDLDIAITIQLMLASYPATPVGDALRKIDELEAKTKEKSQGKEE